MNELIRGNIIVVHQRGDLSIAPHKYRFTITADTIYNFKIVCDQILESIRKQYRAETVEIQWEYENIG
jgi:hypothetical protein